MSEYAGKKIFKLRVEFVNTWMDQFALLTTSIEENPGSIRTLNLIKERKSAGSCYEIYLRSLISTPTPEGPSQRISKFKQTYILAEELHSTILPFISLSWRNIYPAHYSSFSYSYNGVLTDERCRPRKSSSMLLLSNVCHSTIMKLLGFAYLAILVGVSSANEQMQINYYSDSGCSENVGQVDVTWAGGSNCYNYNYGNSVNIASCYEDNCWCYFYNQQNCAGNGAIVVANSDSNCLAGSSAYNSFACYYNWSGLSKVSERQFLLVC